MRRHSFVSAAIGVLFSWSIAAAQTGPVNGTITYRERIALPPTAVVEVTLVDVSRADAPALVVGRQRIERPNQVPIRFAVDYDQQAIDPRHRYAVRATIADGASLMFTSTETVLVITQGHGLRADLVLRRVAPLPAPPKSAVSSPPSVAPPSVAPPPSSTAGPPPANSPASPATPPAPPLPANPLVNLPATFSGTLPCADCPGIRVQLNLFRDDSFFLRRTYVGKSTEPVDDLGSWVLSSDRRMLMLKGAADVTMVFALPSAGTMRPLGVDGEPVAGSVPGELRRAVAYQPIDLRATMRGSYVYYADAAAFTECATGQRWPVAPESAALGVERAYLDLKKAPMMPALFMVEGRVAARPNADGPGTEPHLIVSKFIRALPTTDACAPRLASAPLADTHWRLIRLGGQVVPPPADPKREASLTFQAEPARFSGSSGCNRLIGAYTAEQASMTLTAAGTMMACQGGMADEVAFLAALKATRAYRIVGPWLELFDGNGARLAKFEAR